ncbi:cytochrome c oxidase assembly protein [Egibacter rhizosphaerae]|nr:cytochrome c oxidase assembly protein [Egibacter rhizosphaerae]
MHAHWDEAGLAFALVVAVLVVAGLVRGVGSRSLRRGIVFAVGWGLLTLALWSPLHEYGHVSFALHMVQHVLMIAIVPPLLLYARVGHALRDVLPRALIRRSGGALRVGSRIRGGMLSGPGRVVIALTHAVVLWTVHTPALYEAALFSSTVHHIEHLALLASAYAVWWAVMTGPASRIGGSVLGLAVSGAAGGVLATLIIVSPEPWTEAHNPHVVGFAISLLEDQQLGGGVMVLVGSVVWTLAAAVCFVRWLRAIERRQAARDRVDRREVPSP